MDYMGRHEIYWLSYIKYVKVKICSNVDTHKEREYYFKYWESGIEIFAFLMWNKSILISPCDELIK